MDKLFVALGFVILAVGLAISFCYEGGGIGERGYYDAYMGVPIVFGGIIFLIAGFGSKKTLSLL
jgi:hypothetical protein